MPPMPIPTHANERIMNWELYPKAILETLVETISTIKSEEDMTKVAKYKNNRFIFFKPTIILLGKIYWMYLKFEF